MEPKYIARMLAVGLFVFLVGLFVLSARRPGKIDPATGKLTMRYSLALRIMGWLLGIVVPIGFVVLLFIIPFEKPNDAWIAGGMLAFFTLLGGFLLIETQRFRVIVSDEGIESFSPWRPKRVLSWDEITSVKHYSNTSFFVFRGRGGTRIRMPLWLTGLDVVVEKAQEHLDPSVLAGASRAFEMLGGPILRSGGPDRFES
jgi:hypothetical protein